MAPLQTFDFRNRGQASIEFALSILLDNIGAWGAECTGSNDMAKTLHHAETVG